MCILEKLCLSPIKVRGANNICHNLVGLRFYEKRTHYGKGSFDFLNGNLIEAVVGEYVSGRSLQILQCYTFSEFYRKYAFAAKKKHISYCRQNFY